MTKSNDRTLRRLETPEAWLRRRSAPNYFKPTLPATGSLYAQARQAEIADAVDHAGIPERDPNRPKQHSKYAVADFRADYLPDGPLDPPEAERWIATMTDEASWRLEGLKALVEREFGWERRTAEIYILTGLVPAPIKPIQVDWEGERNPVARRLVLTIDPNCSSEEVAAAYTSLRAQVIETRARKRSERNLALALQRYDLRAEELGSWDRRMDHWRALVTEHGEPAWAFDDRRKFYAEVMGLVKNPIHARWREGISAVA